MAQKAQPVRECSTSVKESLDLLPRQTAQLTLQNPQSLEEKLDRILAMVESRTPNPREWSNQCPRLPELHTGPKMGERPEFVLRRWMRMRRLQRSLQIWTRARWRPRILAGRKIMWSWRWTASPKENLHYWAGTLQEMWQWGTQQGNVPNSTGIGCSTSCSSQHLL